MLLSLFLSQRVDTLSLGEGNKGPIESLGPAIPPRPRGGLLRLTGPMGQGLGKSRRVRNLAALPVAGCTRIHPARRTAPLLPHAGAVGGRGLQPVGARPPPFSLAGLTRVGIFPFPPQARQSREEFPVGC